MISVLDFYGCNPWSRLPKSEFKSLEGVRSWVMQYVLQSKGFREQGEKEQFLARKGSRLSGAKVRQRDAKG